MMLVTFGTNVFNRPFNRVVGYVIVPFEQGIAKAGEWLANRSDELVQIRTLLAENSALKELEEEGKGAVVYGRDIVTGLPVEREIPTRMVDESLEEHFNTIIDNVKVILERTPPELAADIYRHGIYLTGGASQVSHLAERLATGTGLHVNVAENPLTSVATGLAKIIKDDNYKTVAYAIEGMSK